MVRGTTAGEVISVSPKTEEVPQRTAKTGAKPAGAGLAVPPLPHTTVTEAANHHLPTPSFFKHGTSSQCQIKTTEPLSLTRDISHLRAPSPCRRNAREAE